MKGAMFQETNTTLKQCKLANRVREKKFGYNALSYKDVVLMYYTAFTQVYFIVFFTTIRIQRSTCDQT